MNGLMCTETAFQGIRQWVVVLAIVGLLGGCAASGELVESESTKIHVDTRKTAAIVVTSVADGGEAQLDAVRTELASQLLAKRVFAAVQSDVAAADTLLQVTVARFSGVSGAARVMFGALAGQAEIELMVTVVDGKTGATLGEVSAVGKSSGGHIFAGTTPEAIQKAVTLIVDYLLRNRTAMGRLTSSVG